VDSIRKRDPELDGTGSWAYGYTTPPIPALSGIDHDRRLPLLGIGKQDVHLTDIDAHVTAVTDLWIKHKGIKHSRLWYNRDFFCTHRSSPSR
jgi:hypothetical protein